MFVRKGLLNVPDSFEFPFTPYGIQQEFMENLYSVIESRQIGIFESPTGTGKSLTLTCGSIKWLLDNNELIRAELKKSQLELQDSISTREREETSDWLETQHGTISMKEELQKLKTTYEFIQKHDRKMGEMKRNVHKLKKTKSVGVTRKPTTTLPETETPKLEDSDLELNDCSSSGESSDEEVDKETARPYRPTKIFFCSRTHSQLSQVIREIQGTSFRDRVRLASLASRQIYCVNDAVKNSGSQSVINERCLDLQKKKSTNVSKRDEDGNTLKKSKQTSSAGCPYNNKSNVDQLKQEILSDIHDIEDLVAAGQRERACPYYASRAAAEDAEIVLLPYQLLFHKNTRLQSGVDIRDAVIIVDEAHNLMDTLSAIHSTEVTLDQLRAALAQVGVYKARFKTRFKASNLLKVNQIEFIIKQLVRILDQKKLGVTSRMVLGYELMAEAEFFNLDIMKLLRFCDESRFAQKVHGLAQRNANAPVSEPIRAESSSSSKSLLKQLEDKFNSKKKSAAIPLISVVARQGAGKVERQQFVPQVIRPLLAFLESLTEKSSDGRVFIEAGVKMKYLLLNCGSHFQDFLTDCRSVSTKRLSNPPHAPLSNCSFSHLQLIVAGGTMRPTNELKDQLFTTQKQRIREFCFGHVVPPTAILPVVVAKGPSGHRFLFNFATKLQVELMTDLGKCFVDIAQVVPAGIVVFFASYDYLHAVHDHLRREGLLNQIQRYKDIFIEPKQAGQTTDRILHEYSVAIRRGVKKGAMLFSVVGGKLSEGLNFSDDLGRCVIVVGMPYPNKTSPELVQKMKYLEENLKRGSGSEYYENLCMKAVNQCIGRAVRHIDDYATILLLDERYGQDRIQEKLPEWIRISMELNEKYSGIAPELKLFFENKLKK